MLSFSISRIVLILLSSLHPIRAVTCTPSPGLPPLVPHCIELVSKLLLSSRRPGASIPKRWGRKLDNTATTVHLPKEFWIAGDGPRTCGVIVDAVFHDSEVTEKLTMGSIAYGAERILNSCLHLGVSGTERVGAGKRVMVSMVRIDKDNILRNVRGVLRRPVLDVHEASWTQEGNVTSMIVDDLAEDEVADL